MATISVCMIVRDEQETLARCLSCVTSFADEIIIVDTGSVDNTKEIAKQYTDLIYDFEWCFDFAQARNVSFEKATMDYCMWLDADDVLAPEEQKKIQNLKQRLDKEQPDIVKMQYDAGFDEQGNVTFSYVRERMIRNTGNIRPWKGRVHEVMVIDGRVLYEDIHIMHKKQKAYDTDRNLQIYEKMKRENYVFDPREQFYYARELYYHKRYEEAIDIFEQFLKREDGWIENKIEACRQVAICYEQIQNTKKQLFWLLYSFVYDTPRAETCCDLGQYYMSCAQWNQAIFWYETALRIEPEEHSGAFIQQWCYGYLPCIQLCVCYDHIGDTLRAQQYNEMASVFQPESKAVLHNRAYFQHKVEQNHIKS